MAEEQKTVQIVQRLTEREAMLVGRMMIRAQMAQAQASALAASANDALALIRKDPESRFDQEIGAFVKEVKA